MVSILKPTDGRLKPKLGDENSNWKGGRYVNFQGYVFVSAPAHPYKNKDNMVAEHRLIAEKALGRCLKPTEKVHHVDGNTGNNIRSNLVICENALYHTIIHRRKRALEKSGHANWRPCRICGKYDDPKHLFISKNGKAIYHPKCNSKAQVIRKMKLFGHIPQDKTLLKHGIDVNFV